MHFDLNETARDFAGVVAEIVSGEPDGPALWDQLSQVGVLDLLVPEDQEGLGFSEEEMVAVLRELGRLPIDEPILETMCLRPILHAHLGLEPGQRITWATDGNLVPWAEEGTLPVASASADDPLRKVDGTGTALDTVDPGRPVSPVENSSAIEGIPAEHVAQAWHRGALGAAAMTVGLMQRMLELAVEHVTVREQFGVPIGSFQAVQHHLATVKVALDAAWPLVLQAAWSCRELPETEAALQVSAAKYHVAQAARTVSGLTLQAHGAIGYTTEYPLHALIKRSWALESAFGDAQSHLRRISADLELYLNLSPNHPDTKEDDD